MGYDYKNHIKKPESDLQIIFMELQDNLLCALDTFTLVQQYDIWRKNLDIDEPSDHTVDKIIAMKLKEYLIIQLTAIFFDRSSIPVSSVHNLKKSLPECKKYLVHEFTNKHVGLIKRMGCLRNKIFAHNEILTNDSIKRLIDEYRNNVSNDDLDNLFKDAFKMLHNLAYADLDLPDPLDSSYYEQDIIEWFKEK